MVGSFQYLCSIGYVYRFAGCARMESGSSIFHEATIDCTLTWLLCILKGLDLQLALSLSIHSSLSLPQIKFFQNTCCLVLCGHQRGKNRRIT